MQTSLSAISAKGETVWRVGPCDQKQEKRLKQNLALLTSPANQTKIANEPLPYTIEPISYSIHTSPKSNFKVMPESIARYSFEDKKKRELDRELFHHSIQDFILDMILPIPMAGCLTLFAMQNFKLEREMLTISKTHKEHCIVLTGSSSDGLSLPEITHMTRKIKVTEGPDEDKIFIFTSLVVDSENRRAFCSLDTSKSPPGYTKLIFNKAWLEKRRSKYPRERVEETLIRNNYPRFVSSDESDIVLRNKLVSILRKHLKNEIRNRDKERLFSRSTPFSESFPSILFSCHGPAVTCDLERNDFMKVAVSTDNVVALPCPRWPKHAAEWLKRDRVWPPKRTCSLCCKAGLSYCTKGR